MADRVTFTKSSAERIATVVRIVEAGNRDTGGLPTAPRFGGGGGAAIKFCSWAATWAYAQTATVTFTSAATATANNVFLGVGPGDGWVAKKGSTGWALVSVDLTKQPGYSSGEIQLFGHSTNSAVAQWYSITTCATATG